MTTVKVSPVSKEAPSFPVSESYNICNWIPFHMLQFFGFTSRYRSPGADSRACLQHIAAILLCACSLTNAGFRSSLYFIDQKSADFVAETQIALDRVIHYTEDLTYTLRGPLVLIFFLFNSKHIAALSSSLQNVVTFEFRGVTNNFLNWSIGTKCKTVALSLTIFTGLFGLIFDGTWWYTSYGDEWSVDLVFNATPYWTAGFWLWIPMVSLPYFLVQQIWLLILLCGIILYFATTLLYNKITNLSTTLTCIIINQTKGNYDTVHLKNELTVLLDFYEKLLQLSECITNLFTWPVGVVFSCDVIMMLSFVSQVVKELGASEPSGGFTLFHLGAAIVMAVYIIGFLWPLALAQSKGAELRKALSMINKHCMPIMAQEKDSNHLRNVLDTFILACEEWRIEFIAARFFTITKGFLFNTLTLTLTVVLICRELFRERKEPGVYCISPTDHNDSRN